MEWYMRYDGQVFISFSGGKDSTVLLDLARRVYPDIPAVYVDTGLEYEGVIFTDGATEVVYYNQLDERWADLPYGTDNIGGYGCGPTSMAIVVSSLTDQTVDPPTMAEWAYQNGYWCSGNGSYHSLIPGAAEGFGLQWESISTDDPQAVVDALASRKLIVALMSKGHFTSSGHFMVLRGVTSEGKILVADPASKKRSEQEWDILALSSGNIVNGTTAVTVKFNIPERE